ncbi:MAG: hypothetical protein KME42_06660 [Tildeniella nuda ZEHNDER 1965/U140]|nr:hypothetical protein [Tildeniella nuda ZEHNDER 1965/U140]
MPCNVKAVKEAGAGEAREQGKQGKQGSRGAGEAGEAREAGEGAIQHFFLHPTPHTPHPTPVSLPPLGIRLSLLP